MNAKQLADARREEIAALMAKNGGVVRPADVVAFARDARTALHSLFEWDNSQAAEKFRELQAASYIRAVVRVLPRESGDPVMVRAYVSLSSERGTGGYRAVGEVLSDEELRAQMVRDALNEMQAFARKYRHLSELAGVWLALDAVTEREAPAIAA